jgi:hypothetical protein
MIFWSDGGSFSGSGSCESTSVEVAEELFSFFGSAPAIAKFDDCDRSRLVYWVECLSCIKKEHPLPSALLGLGILQRDDFLEMR